MPSQQFTLIVEGADLRSARVFDALFEAGCDDATVGSIDETHQIDFDRDAANLGEAILSAVRDVEKVEGLRVRRVVDIDLVSVADIAKRTGRTRESVRSLVAGARGPGGFPAPVPGPGSGYRFWRWPDVKQWFGESLGESVAVDEQMLTAINASLDLRRCQAALTPSGRESLRALAQLG